MSPRLKAAKRDSGTRLDRFLQDTVGVSLRGARRLIEDGLVLVNGRSRPALYRLHADDDISVEPGKNAAVHPLRTALRPAAMEPDTAADYAEEARLLGLTADYAFFHKPAGMHSVALSGASTASLEGLLPSLWQAAARTALSGGHAPFGTSGTPDARETLHPFYSAALPCLPNPPHTLPSPETPLPTALPELLTRLDAQTAGIIAAALSRDAATRFRAMEAEGKIAKYYLALVRGIFPEERELCRALDSAKRRVTRVLDYETSDPARTTRIIPVESPAEHCAPGTSLVLARIRRGARHQIRAHLAHAGFPLAGDTLYSGEEKGNGSFFLHHVCMELPGVSVCDPPAYLPGAPLRLERDQ